MESNYCIYLLEAAVLTIICGWVGIPLLKKLKARQSIRTEGPKSHRAKSGTPTMGGLFMLTAMVLVVLFNRLLDPSVLWLLFLTLGHGLLGFLDDFIKAEKKRNLGLTAKQKMLGQLILAVLFCWGVVDTLHLPYSIAIPFTDMDISIGLLYYPFVVLVIVGASNAVNLTDGLDGLASGCCVIAFTAYAVLTTTKIDGRVILNLGHYNFPQHKYMLGVYSHLIVLVVGYLASFFFKSEKATEELTIYGYFKLKEKK